MDSNATLPAPDWRAILAREIKAAGKRGKAAVAERMGVKRSYVSRAMSVGKSAYTEVPDAFIRRVMDLESDVDCPATGDRRPRADCRKANDPAPTCASPAPPRRRPRRQWACMPTCKPSSTPPAP